MKIVSNVTENNFIFNQPVTYTLWKDNLPPQIFTVNLISFKDCYFNFPIQNFIALLKTDIEEIKQRGGAFELCETIWDAIKLCIYFCGDAYSFDKDMLTIALKQLIPQIDLDSFPSVCGIQIDDELFESLSNLWLVSAGMKRINELNTYMTPEMREMQKRINRIRKQGKNNSATQGNADYENTYMTLSYEFGYSQEQILSMTMYQVNKMLQYAGKSIQYKVSLIGAGNGLTKKVKFITER